MKQPPFEMERWQSHWENRVEHNLSESGVHPLTLDELCDLAAVDPGDTSLGYGHTDGSEELRARIAALHPGASAGSVVATCGSAEANFVALWRLVEPGDRVVVLRPTYAQTPGLAEGLGAEVVDVWLEEERGWQPAPGAIDAAVGEGARLVVVTNPNNPTGAVLGDAARREIAEAADRSGAWILSDEVYAGSELSGERTPSLWGATERVLVTGSLSKAYGLPGLRLGWIVAPGDWREEMWARKDYTTIAPSALSDRLAAAALSDAVRQRILERTREILHVNLGVLDRWVAARAGRSGPVRMRRPDAGAIAFLGYDGGASSSALAERLRAERGVLVVPGDHFGLDGYLRIGYGFVGAGLADALDRLGAVLDAERAG
jgi:hypothetical protein